MQLATTPLRLRRSAPASATRRTRPAAAARCPLARRFSPSPPHTRKHLPDSARTPGKFHNTTKLQQRAAHASAAKRGRTAAARRPWPSSGFRQRDEPQAAGTVTRVARLISSLRPYHPESSGTHQNSELKQGRARVVLWWGTTREGRVMQTNIIIFFRLFDAPRALCDLYSFGRSPRTAARAPSRANQRPAGTPAPL
jgi:hypothetical protein